MNSRTHRTAYLQSIIALIGNLALAYVLYFIARIVFLFCNYNVFSGVLSFTSFFNIYRGGFYFDTSAICYTNMLYIVLMLVPYHGKERTLYKRVCKWVYMIPNSLALIVNLMDAVYFPFTMRRTTTSVFREFSGENNLVGIFFNAALTYWYLIVIAVILIYALHRLYIKPKSSYKDFVTLRQRVVYSVVMFVALVVSVPLVIGGCRGGLSSGIRPITINNANEYVKKPVYCALVLNTPFSMLRTIGKSVFVVPDYYKNLEEAEKVFSPIHNTKLKNSFTNKNVVILIVESFGREYIGAFNKGLEDGKYKGYTPNVDKLIEKSSVWEYSFANGHKSIDGMPSVLCGIPMLIEPFVLTPSSMNDYTGIAGLLSAKGYETAFFHGANRGSMGFLAFANKIGFKHYYGRQDYASDPRFGGDKDFDGNWGIWDEPFLQYFSAKMSEMKEPFMTALFTVSSHHPFVIPKQYKDVYKEEELPIHKCIRYTDMAIGKFFEEAKKQAWYKNTIFVLTSDHTNMSNHDEYRSDIGEFSAPIIIFDPSGEIESDMHEGIAQQIDIMPTILGLLGFDEPYLSFGIDLFDTPACATFAINYFNGVYQYTKYGYVLQWDGKKTKGIYSLSDRLMKDNLVGKVPVQAQMEKEVKALIYSYMYRMVNDKLRQ